MSLTLSALLIIFIAAPGFIALNAFQGRIGALSSDGYVGDQRWQSYAITSLFVALPVHAILIGLLAITPLPDAQLAVALSLLAGNSGADATPALDDIARNAGWIVTYLGLSLLVAGLLGGGVRAWITTRNLDLKYRFLRLSNPWHYLFLGAEQPEMPDLAVLTVSVEMGGTTWLYTGILDHYEYFPDGRLKYVRLVGAQRRRIDEDRPSGVDDDPARYYTLDGEYLIVFFPDVKTMNIDYLYRIPDDPTPGNPQE
ncbi:MAG: hypothetical protein AAF610_01635 [Pseudomonadota bacterium]